MIEFTESGYLEVYRGVDFVSRHSAERKAIQSVLSHTASNGPGRYEIRRPALLVNVTADQVFEVNGSAVLP